MRQVLLIILLSSSLAFAQDDKLEQLKNAFAQYNDSGLSLDELEKVAKEAGESAYPVMLEFMKDADTGVRNLFLTIISSDREYMYNLLKERKLTITDVICWTKDLDDDRLLGPDGYEWRGIHGSVLDVIDHRMKFEESSLIINEVRLLLKDKDAGVRKIACWYFVRAKFCVSFNDLKDIIPLLKDEDTGVKFMAIHAAWELGRNGPHMEHTVKNRPYNIEYTGKTPYDADVRKVLTSLLKDENAIIRKDALWCLAVFNDPEIVDKIKLALKDTDSGVRALALTRIYYSQLNSLLADVASFLDDNVEIQTGYVINLILDDIEIAKLHGWTTKFIVGGWSRSLTDPSKCPFKDDQGDCKKLSEVAVWTFMKLCNLKYEGENSDELIKKCKKWIEENK